MLYRKGWETVFRLEEAWLQDHDLYHELLEASEKLSVSNGCRFYEPSPYHIGIVCDEFIYLNYEPACHLHYLPSDWQEDMLAGLDLVLVVSPWRGIDQSWAGVSLASSGARESLFRLLRLCRRCSIPTAFYSKEDPPNFRIFLSCAKEADFVFTSAVECIPAYQRECGHDRVYPLHFAVNPLLNNPIDSERYAADQNAVLFAGSWMKKYPQRIREQRQLFQWIQETGVPFHILDRNSGRRDPAYRYPARWQKNLLPAVPYGSLPKMNKLHGWVLNLNSVTDSRSMFSMRVYDALACGCPVLSNGSAGMERLLPEVRVIRTREDIDAAFSMTREERKALRLAGIRRVMEGNTVFDRMTEILTGCGLTAPPVRRTVAVLADCLPEEAHALAEQFQAQTYPDKVFLTDKEELRNLEDVSALALWKSDRRYGRFYLEDCMNAFRYTASDYTVFGQTEDGEAFVFSDSAADPFSTVYWINGSLKKRIPSILAGQTRLNAGFWLSD